MTPFWPLLYSVGFSRINVKPLKFFLPNTQLEFLMESWDLRAWRTHDDVLIISEVLEATLVGKVEGP